MFVALHLNPAGHMLQPGPQNFPPTQVLPVLGHKWKLLAASQTQPHVPLLQPGTALAGMFVGVGHVMQLVPHASAVLLGTQVGAAAVPRLQNPGVSHTYPQAKAPPAGAVQVASPWSAGAAQAVHDVPQLPGSSLGTHWNVGPVAGQRWKPAWHAMAHALLVQTRIALAIDGIGQVMHDVEVPH